MLITTGTEYSCKVEICKESNIVNLVKYNKSIKSDMSKNLASGSSIKSDLQYQENKRKTLYKSAKKIMSLVKYNAGQYSCSNGKKFPPIFLTLTFSDNVQDWDYANNEHMKFIRRLNYFVYGKKCSDLRYISVPELQDRGAIHYHILFFNLPYIDKSVVQELWGLGRTRIEQEKKFQEMNGESLGKYITKYMTKQFYNKDKKGNYKFYYDRSTWEGKKTYFVSKNLIKPVVFKIVDSELNDIDFIFEGVPFESKVNTIKVDDDVVVFSTEMEYKLSKEKIRYLLAVLPMCKGKYVKSKFYINSKSVKMCNSILDIGKTVLGWKHEPIRFSWGSVTPVSGEF